MAHQGSKTIERVVRGIVKAQRQAQRREVVKQRLENNERATKQAIVVPRFDILSGGHR
jgi:hypothetical protein